MLNILNLSITFLEYLNLLKDYLTGRQQRTIANGGISRWKDVSYGVLEGSTLGPLLFLVFVDDVMNLDIEAKSVLYADDIVLHCSNNTVDNNLLVLKNDMEKIFEWSKGRHQNTQQRIAKDDKSLLVSLQNLAFF